MSNMTLSFNKNGELVVIQCTSNDTLRKIFDRYCIKAGVNRNEATFYYNSQKMIEDDRTLQEHNIVHRGVFDVVMSKNL